METIHQIKADTNTTNVVAPPAATSATVAAEINKEHRLKVLADRCASRHKAIAVQHAIKCGQLLIKQKEKLQHGEFNVWIRAHCNFKRSTPQPATCEPLVKLLRA
ncbi:MAG: DUF3102 domain-containing protein [Steroidobacteraceae bacterium]